MLKHRVVTQSRVADAETQRKSLHSPGPTTLKHKGSRYTVSGQQQPYNKAQIPWLKQPTICDAETTSTTTRRNCYSNCNNNISFSTCNSIMLRETRTSYFGLVALTKNRTQIHIVIFDQLYRRDSLFK
jgi:hypothetical protein